jgi:hypothetical protein
LILPNKLKLKVESEIKSPWTLKTILNDIKNILC